MIEVALPDGVALEFPDDMPAAEIEQAIKQHLESARRSTDSVRDSFDASEAPREHSPVAAGPPPQPGDVLHGDGDHSGAELEPPIESVIVPSACRFRLGPYQPGAGSLDDLICHAPEVAPAGGVCRAVLARCRPSPPIDAAIGWYSGWCPR